MQKIVSENFFQDNFVCENSIVKLRPITLADIQNFKNFVLDQKIWQYIPYRMREPQDMENYVEEALAQRTLNARYHFVIEDKKIGNIVGSSALINYSKENSRIEIGRSWLDTESQGKDINKNAKFLLLNLAFDHLNIERVEFKTDALNLRARNALIKIGATEEGILRKHTLMPDGRRRDIIYYSILKDEWHNQIKLANFSDCID